MLNRFVGGLIDKLDPVDRMTLELEEGWFSLRAEGTHSVMGPIGVDYTLEASFEVELLEYDGEHQRIQFRQRGETELRGREYLDDLMTKLADDPLPGLLLDLDYVRYRNRAYVFELERSGLGAFFGGELAGVPVSRLLPVSDIELERGRLRLYFDPPATEQIQSPGEEP